MSLRITSEQDEVNDVDGTSGDWEIQPGIGHIYLINKTTGAKFMLHMHQIIEPTVEED